MIRTIISMDPDDKAWLDRKAKLEKAPMARLIRRAIRKLREESEATPSRFDSLLTETAGMCRNRDGLSIQRSLRDEWSKRK